MIAPVGETKGYLSLVLHAHLPFVRHPEHDHFLEENWLFEAITETYLPLLMMYDNLVEDKVPYRLAMSLTPPLCSMLADPLLQERYAAHIARLEELAHREIERTAGDARFLETARMYQKKFASCRIAYETVYERDLLGAFARLQKSGHLDLMTCGATHGYLPNMSANPKAVRAQILVAVQSHQRFFGTWPQGIWLPECGYYPGVETFLQEAGLRYFFTDTHGILFAEPRPKYGAFAPVYCGETHVAAFGRDVESTRAVWNAKQGYPGDAAYREFYRDIGYDLDMEYLQPYIDPAGMRMNTGIKYHRITGTDTQAKGPYSRAEALRRAAEHATDFVNNRTKQISHVSSLMDRPPIVVAPYDAELFGHWWYEGPEWLNYVIRASMSQSNRYTLITPGDYLERHPVNQKCSPAFSSWGKDGYSEMWLEKSNDWIYRHVHSMEIRMTSAARENPSAQGLRLRTLQQMARELLLAESSDWAFIMKTGTMVEYAVRRSKVHIGNFNRLYNDLVKDTIDENFLSLLETHNNIFPAIDYRVYA